MKNIKLFILLAFMSFIPWSYLLESVGGPHIQLIGLAVQSIGLTFLVTRRKEIF